MVLGVSQFFWQGTGDSQSKATAFLNWCTCPSHRPRLACPETSHPLRVRVGVCVHRRVNPAFHRHGADFAETDPFHRLSLGFACSLFQECRFRQHLADDSARASRRWKSRRIGVRRSRCSHCHGFSRRSGRGTHGDWRTRLVPRCRKSGPRRLGSRSWHKRGVRTKDSAVREGTEGRTDVVP
jgi:hypothetical protein